MVDATMEVPNAPAPEAPSTLAVRLTTKSQQYSIPNARYMVPADWRRFQLSELINKVLETTEPVPFDFILADQLIRTTLGAFVQAAGLSTEATLEIEYVESVLPPRELASFPHDDWVSDLDLSKPGLFVSACYDAMIRVFSASASSTPLANLPGHSGSALSSCWVRPSFSTPDASLLASAGMDRTIRVWSLPTPSPLAPLEPASGSTKTAFALPFHTQPVSSVRSSPTSSHLLSASWDGTVALWDLGSSEADRRLGSGEEIEDLDPAGDPASAARARKRRRRGTDQSETVIKQPVTILRGHEGTICRALFAPCSSGTPTTAYSTGADHCIRSWDLETSINSSTKRGSAEKSPLDVALLSSSGAVVAAAGCTDRTISLFDSRDAAAVSLALTGHTAPVSSVVSHPQQGVASPGSSGGVLLSGSYDGTAKLWDPRSPRAALASVKRPEVEGKGLKVTCVGWGGEGGELFAAGGEDGMVRVYRTNRSGEVELVR